MTLQEAITAIGDNIDYQGDETKAINLYNALNYLIIMRPSGSSINGINLNFSELITLKNTLEIHINQMQTPFLTTAYINRNI